MGIPDGAHTHGSGGSGLGTALLVLVGAALAVKLAGRAVAAVGELVHVLLIVVVVIGGVGAAGLVAFITWRWRRTRIDAARAISPLSPEVARAASLLGPRPAIERPTEVHLHLHGVSAEDIAAVLARRQDRRADRGGKSPG
jgi:hypothetical protein